MKRRLMLSLMAAITLTGCLAEDKKYGFSTGYGRSYPEPIKIVMPRNAPSITQQFRSPTVVKTGTVAWEPHHGFDVHAKIGTPVVAVAPGKVIKSYWEPAYGNRVVVQHGTGEPGKTAYTRYVHLKKRTVQAGDVLARGDQLGELGTTGFLSSGFPHLHMELTIDKNNSASYAKDPHLYWADGVGRVTCLTGDNKDLPAMPLKLTYPLLCK